MATTQDLGIVTSYAYARDIGGYTGSETEYGIYLANLPSYATQAQTARDQAVAAEQASEAVKTLVEADKAATETYKNDAMYASDISYNAATDSLNYKNDALAASQYANARAVDSKTEADRSTSQAVRAETALSQTIVAKNETVEYATTSQSWAVGGTHSRPGEDGNNAKFWAQQAQSVIGGAGGLVPRGTVSFEGLTPVTQVAVGSMYNISNEFTSTADFEEGAGIKYPAGTNVYAISHSAPPSSGTYYGEKWDVLAGNLVSGVKGGAEEDYRTGNIDITKDNIGLGRVENVKLFDQDAEPTNIENKDTWFPTEDYVFLKFYGQKITSESEEARADWEAREAWYEKIKVTKGDPFPTISDPVSDIGSTFTGWSPALPNDVPDEDTKYFSQWV